MMRKFLLVGFAVVVAVAAIVLIQLDSSPTSNDGSDNFQENDENWQPPKKPFWGVPEENIVEFIKAAERENLYWKYLDWKYKSITHISFYPRFRELVEEYGGWWEDENGQIHGVR